MAIHHGPPIDGSIVAEPALSVERVVSLERSGDLGDTGSSISQTLLVDWVDGSASNLFACLGPDELTVHFFNLRPQIPRKELNLNASFT